MRPVGHITDLINELDRWATNRERIAERHRALGHHRDARKISAEPLRRAIAYLEEYRDLLAPLLAPPDGCPIHPVSATSAKRWGPRWQCGPDCGQPVGEGDIVLLPPSQ